MIVLRNVFYCKELVSQHDHYELRITNYENKY